MTLAVALAAGVCCAAGVYLMLSRDLVRCVIGLSILGSGANLVIFAAGRLGSDVPPLVPAGAVALLDSANPVPQALVLTAIVIGLALTCFSLVLVTRLLQESGSDDSDALRFAEPEPSDPLAPPLDAPDPEARAR